MTKNLIQAIAVICLIWPKLCSAQETMFLGNKSTFSSRGSYWTQEFVVSSTSRFVLRVAADYNVQAAVMDASQAFNFKNQGSFTSYAIFDSNFGTRSLTLGPGTYCLGIRNLTNTGNQYDIELDKELVVEADSDGSYTFVDHPIQGTDYVSEGNGQLWHSFTMLAGYRYFLDGANSGLDTYILPAAELENFRNRRTFNYYSGYEGFGDASQPGFYELKLPPGDYVLAFSNPSSIAKAVTYTMERWQINEPPGNPDSGLQLELGGPISWRVSGKNIRLKVGKVSCFFGNSGSSGSLRLRLWASRRQYKGVAIRAYALSTFSLMPLEVGQSYSEINRLIRLKRPPAGRYYSFLTLEEFTEQGWVQVDYLSFLGTYRF